MAYWETPLTPERVKAIITANEKNGEVTVMVGPLGQMVKVCCIEINNPKYNGLNYYCGGDRSRHDVWLAEEDFFSGISRI